MRADVWPLTTVDPLVAPQCSGSGEALVADAAVVRFVSCVAAHVRFHVLERLAADAAGPTGLSVRPQVSQQGVW